MGSVTLLMLGALMIVSIAEGRAPIGRCKKGYTKDLGNTRPHNSQFNIMTVPVKKLGSFIIDVKATHDVFINFISSENEKANSAAITSDDALSGVIVLGGWNNRKSGAYCHRSQDWTQYNTPYILDPSGERRKFEVKWATVNGMFEVQIIDRFGELIFKHEFSCVKNFGYVGIASAWGSSALWTICFDCVDDANNCDDPQAARYCNSERTSSAMAAFVHDRCTKTCGFCVPDKREEDEMDRKNVIRNLLDEIRGI